MEDKISVVIPVYKVEPYLDQCVQSVVDQTYTNLEIILVDDGSPDNCPAMCDAWAERDSRIKVIHKQNGGVSDARNAGLEAASGDYILFIDSDDIISVNFIEFLHKPLKCTVAANVASSVLHVTEDYKYTNHPMEFTSSFEQILWDNMACKREGWFAWGILYQASIVRAYHIKFDISLKNLEDMYWNSIISAYCKDVLYVPDAIYMYRNRSGSITSKCMDVVWQSECNLRVAKILSEDINKGTFSKMQVGTLLKQRRICINAAFFELYTGKNKMNSSLREMLRQSRLSPIKVLSAKIDIKRKCLELIFSVCTFLESSFVYNAMFMLRDHIWT